ncbi:hypothetical protein HPB50_025682 [Hyalomma asiaticum]|uniref:Uncharacterized protein n=1 Tax=Hyalomma asiaticum TaxID=266040 RepID=A0ACB7T982_HYAAI|nr:hypothetical protein HPB50_025682 [Hyalomma asiaticum]
MAPRRLAVPRAARFFFSLDRGDQSPEYDAAGKMAVSMRSVAGDGLVADAVTLTAFASCVEPRPRGSRAVRWLPCLDRRLDAVVDGVKPKTPVLRSRRHRSALQNVSGCSWELRFVLAACWSRALCFGTPQKGIAPGRYRRCGYVLRFLGETRRRSVVREE